MRRVISTAAVAGALAISLIAGVTPANAEGNATTITGGGSSFQDDFTTKCAAKFSAKTGKSVTYTKSSSGTGRKDFDANTIDFAGSDSYKATAKASVYVPISGAPIAFFANVGKLKTLKLDATTASKIFKGEITTWNDPAIAALNKGVKLPATAIAVQYRSGTSGTNNAVTSYFSQVIGGWSANDDWAKGVGATPPGTASANSAALVQATAQTAGGFGYADLSDVIGQKALTIVTLKNNKGQFVKPSVATGKKALDAQKTANENGYVDMQYKRGTGGAYDLVTFTYLIAPTGAGTEAAALVKEYATFVVNTCMPNPKSIGAGNYSGISKTSLTGKKAIAQVAKIG
jgi:phosphate transport system substrate-binding protein